MAAKSIEEQATKSASPDIASVRPAPTSLSLRTLLWRTFMSFAALFVGAASALVMMTTRLHHSDVAAIDSLVDHKVALSRIFEEAASRDAVIAVALSACVGILGILVVTVVMAVFQRLVGAPLTQLETAITRFTHGDHDTRAPEDGPSELQQVARVFNDMAANLALRNEQQRLLLAGVAHDLRNPLCAMRVSLRAAFEPIAERDDRQGRILSIIDRQFERVSTMLDDFLDAARIEAGSLELRPAVWDLRDIVMESTELYRSFSPRHPLEVRLPDEAVWINGDSTRITQVVNNLLSNAIKYSPGGCLVGVFLVQHHVGQAELAVSDQGIGIDPAELVQIFSPFQRTSASRAVPGSGLGLSVVRRILDGHNGRIEVQSQPGRGSTFRIWLPTVSMSARVMHLAPDDVSGARANC